MISCLAWIPKGVADPKPKRYEMSQIEMEIMEQQTRWQAEALSNDNEQNDENDEEDETVSNPQKSKIILPKIDPSSLPEDLRMEEYTDDEDEDEAQSGAMLGQMLVGNDSEMIVTEDERGIKIAEDSDDDDDQVDDEIHPDSDNSDGEDDAEDDDFEDIPDTREFIPIDVEGLQAMGISQSGFDDDDDDDNNDDDSDVDDHNLRADDAIVVVAKTEDDFASLEVHVYEERTGNLFVHHDIPLPSFPLCLAHGDINHEGGAGNYIAVGTFLPGIEVWNLDILQPLEPTFTIGGEDTSAADELMKTNMKRAATGKKLKKPKLARAGLLPGSHTDAVMALSWSTVHRHILASGSADTTVKIWDVTRASKGSEESCNLSTWTHHKDKVQSVVWHPVEGSLLATGSYDRTIAILDARSEGGGSKSSLNQNIKKGHISGDCEALVWDPHQPHLLTCASENGVLSNWDIRNFEKPLWSKVVAEYGGVSDLSYNRNVPGMLVTCAPNKTITIWDTLSNTLASHPPVCRCNKSMEVGKLFTVDFYPSSPWLLGCGGSGNELALWDMSQDSVIQQHFGDRTNKPLFPASEMSYFDPKKEEDYEASMALEAKIESEISQEQNQAPSAKKSKKKGKKKPAHKKAR